MNGIYFDISTEDITLVASDGHKSGTLQDLCRTRSRKSCLHPSEEAGQPAEEPAAEGTGRRTDWL